MITVDGGLPACRGKPDDQIGDLPDATLARMVVPFAAMYTDAGHCTFPGCDRAVPLTRLGTDRSRLCFDHGEMLFFDIDEFVRLWEEHDPGGVPGR